MHRPTAAEFAALARTHSVVPVFRTLVADALTPGARLPHPARRRVGVPVRERGRRRAGGAVQHPRLGPVPPVRGVREHRPRTDRGGTGRRVRAPGPAEAPGGTHQPVPGAAGARPAAVQRRGGGVRRLRRRAVRRAPAEHPAGRPPHPGPLFRLLRRDGHLRPHQQDGAGGGPRPRVAGGCGGSGVECGGRVSAGVWAGGRPRRQTRRAVRAAAAARHRPAHPIPRPRHPLSEQLHPRAVAPHDRPREGVHPERGRVPVRAQPAVPHPHRRRPVRHLPGAAGDQPQPVHVLRGRRRHATGGGVRRRSCAGWRTAR